MSGLSSSGLDSSGLDSSGLGRPELNAALRHQTAPQRPRAGYRPGPATSAGRSGAGGARPGPGSLPVGFGAAPRLPSRNPPVALGRHPGPGAAARAVPGSARPARPLRPGASPPRRASGRGAGAGVRCRRRDRARWAPVAARPPGAPASPTPPGAHPAARPNPTRPPRPPAS